MRLAFAVCCAASVIVAGCGGSSGTEEAAPAAPPVSIGRPTTTTTAAATTVAETTTTTVAPTTTTLDPAAQAKAEIAADYAELYALRAELMQNPGMVDRQARLATFHNPAGQGYRSSEDLFARLVTEGRVVTPLDPASAAQWGTLESIELIGDAPYQTAYVWHCISTQLQEALAVDGVAIEGTQRTWALRIRWTAFASDTGWRFETIGDVPNELWDGATACPS
jgi:hypothetical protein